MHSEISGEYVQGINSIQTIEDLIRIYDNDLTLGEIKKSLLKITPYRCPKCNGGGYVSEKYGAYPRHSPDRGYTQDGQYRKIVCNLCNGVGYTKTEKIQKTETRVVGYCHKI